MLLASAAPLMAVVDPALQRKQEHKEAEDLTAPAEPLTDPADDVSKKARKLRKRGQEAVDAAEEAAAAAADLATTAAGDAADLAAAVADEAAKATAAAGEEAVSAAAQLVGSVASDAADMAGAVQAAAEDVQQQAADAIASDSASTADGDAAKQPAGAGSAKPLAAPAGELHEAPQPVAGLPPPPPANTAGTGSAGSSSAPGAAGAAGGGTSAAEVARLKDSLVAMLASLDRGAAATEDQAERVDALVKRLEALGGPVSLSWERPAGGGKPGMALLDGRWRLLYSSGFTSGSLGGRRPGPSFGSSLVTLGQVFQDILTDKEELDNTVDLFLRTSLASLPGLNAAVPTATARLRHTFKVLNGKTIEITFIDTEVKLAGGLGGWLDSVPRFTVPSLVPEWLQTGKAGKALRSARFDVVYLDEVLRITRGDRGEVRIFAKGMV
ncbi:hypothetical protein ABPG75_007386 [Micractinium tetrahymenae]